MPLFKVTVVERATWTLEKVFEAATEEEARTLAETDGSWSDVDKWKELRNDAGESYIKSVEQIHVK